MYIKWIGAALIVGSCTGFGCSIALHQLREAHLLVALEGIVDQMICELSFRLTPLSPLVRNSAEHAPSVLQSVLLCLADQLDRQLLPDVGSCMESAVRDAGVAYPSLKKMLLQLGYSLGRFDLEGQLKELAYVQEQCRLESLELKNDRRTSSRSYRVLGICAGIALTILLI